MYIEALFSWVHETAGSSTDGKIQVSRDVNNSTDLIKVDSIKELEEVTTSTVNNICKDLGDNETIIFTMSGIRLAYPFVITKILTNESEPDFSDLIELDPYR